MVGTPSPPTSTTMRTSDEGQAAHLPDTAPKLEGDGEVLLAEGDEDHGGKAYRVPQSLLIPNRSSGDCPENLWRTCGYHPIPASQQAHGASGELNVQVRALHLRPERTLRQAEAPMSWPCRSVALGGQTGALVVDPALRPLRCHQRAASGLSLESGWSGRRPRLPGLATYDRVGASPGLLQ